MQIGIELLRAKLAADAIGSNVVGMLQHSLEGKRAGRVIVADFNLADLVITAVAIDRVLRPDQAFVQGTRGSHNLDRRTRLIDRLNGIVVAIFRNVFLEVQIKVRAAAHAENLARLGIHQHHRAADGFELGEAGIELFLNDLLDAHVDGELHVQTRARGFEAARISRHGQAAGVAEMFARTITASEVFFHGCLDSEKALHFGVDLAVLVLLFDFTPKPDQMRRQGWCRVKALV